MLDQTWKTKKFLTHLENAEELENLVFHHSVMCQVGLPRKSTEERVFERTNGNASLKITAGELWEKGGWVEQPLPYGSRPRLILIYLSTKFIQNRSRIIDVGGSLREFLMAIGISPSGDNYHMIKKQLKALVACQMQLGMTKDGYDITMNTHPIRRFEAWGKPNEANEVDWPTSLELSEDFAETLLSHAVPLTNEAIGMLKDSALELDILCWLAHRLCRIKKDKGVLVSWNNLKDQFGQEYKRMSHFKETFTTALRYALMTYKDARLSEVEEGFVLYPSRPLVSKPRTQVLLPEISRKSVKVED